MLRLCHFKQCRIKQIKYYIIHTWTARRDGESSWLPFFDWTDWNQSWNWSLNLTGLTHTFSGITSSLSPCCQETKRSCKSKAGHQALQHFPRSHRHQPLPRMLKKGERGNRLMRTTIEYQLDSQLYSSQMLHFVLQLEKNVGWSSNHFVPSSMLSKLSTRKWYANFVSQKRWHLQLHAEKGETFRDLPPLPTSTKTHSGEEPATPSTISTRHRQKAAQMQLGHCETWEIWPPFHTKNSQAQKCCKSGPMFSHFAVESGPVWDHTETFGTLVVGSRFLQSFPTWWLNKSLL